MRFALAISALAVGLAVATGASTTHAEPAPETPTPSQEKTRHTPVSRSGAATRCRHARQAVPFYRRVTWTIQERHLSDLADPTPIVRGKSCHWARYAAGEWVARARNALRAHSRYLKALRSEATRLYEKWRCIHEHEGAWNANTGNGYYGGLQMDMSFQQAYGPEFLSRWGTADRWPVWAQLKAAERAYVVRGFNPWPNTARMCGLL